MSSIIAAIDFSNTSIHALEYAIVMANQFHADIQLIWVDKVNPQESVYPDVSNEARNEAKKRLDEIMVQYRPQMGKGLKIDYKLKKGKIYREVDNLASTVGAELIVTGAHGISGYEELWIGSNAYKIVTYANSPVITVRHDFPVSRGIRRILVPVDGTTETLHKIPFVAKLAALFHSEVNLVKTHTSALKSIRRITEKNAGRAMEYMKTRGVTCVEEELTSTNLTKAVLEHAARIGADLIAVVTEQETPANILLIAQSQQLINQSPVPVLSVNPHEKFPLS
ncbi:MAG TPA: universal stress protein [Bacteroidales bacterium]|nr:universal stress protein [Bacteroidales bacterium]